MPECKKPGAPTPGSSVTNAGDNYITVRPGWRTVHYTRFDIYTVHRHIMTSTPGAFGITMVHGWDITVRVAGTVNHALVRSGYHSADAYGRTFNMAVESALLACAKQVTR